MNDSPHDAPTLDPASAILDKLPYEEFKLAREGKEPAADPTGEAGAGAPADSAAGTTDQPVEPNPVAGTERGDDGKFVKKAKPRENQHARIEELTFKQREAERRAEAAERRAQELEARLQAPPVDSRPQERSQPAAPQVTRPAPVIDQFAQADDPYLAWQDAMIDWKIEQRDARIEAQAWQRDHQLRMQQHGARVEAAKGNYPDWEAVMTNPALPQLTPVLFESIVGSQRGPEIAYYLGTHPEVFAQLVGESQNAPIEAAPMVRRYLESVSSPAPAPAAANGTGSVQAARHSRATSPPMPVGAGALAARDESPGNESVDSYVLRRNREELQSRGFRTR